MRLAKVIIAVVPLPHPDHTISTWWGPLVLEALLLPLYFWSVSI